MSKDDFESRFARAMEEGLPLLRGGSAALAVSGGADSVAMPHLFCTLTREEHRSLTLHVIHLNHQLRGSDSQADALFVHDLAKSLGVPCTIESVEVAERARAESISIESAGRQCRLEFYERFCLKNDIKVVALAHHADDNAETILHRIIRGTGLRGLAGIRPSRPPRAGSDMHSWLSQGLQNLSRIEPTNSSFLK